MNDLKPIEQNQPQPGTTDNTCSACSGTLFVECGCTEGLGPENAYADCPFCNGTGSTACPTCSAIQP
ncbi:MAG TPA: hypothetical protein GX019_11210 [Firmicutes bacterium]|nr:hypothetical protein [Bacillota bacterium]